jgi:endoglucanase
MSPADRFLSDYVTGDGRVLRHDQGNDVVSEGQAYAMLIAEAAGRTDVVRTVWAWTRAHLQRPDGLLSYHASANGRVLDRQSAADADTLAAYALLRYAGPGAAGLHADGRRLASAVLAHETVRDRQGGLVLVAGPWATGQPAVVDPSYWMPSVFDGLAHLTGDQRWSGLSATAVGLVDRLTAHGRRLPPDWGRFDGTSVRPSGSGGGGGSPQYGPDAQRVPIWFAYSCDPRARSLAASWWAVLQQDNRSSATALTLDGNPVDGSGSTVALVAASAAATAAGDHAGAAQLMAGAAATNQGTPTYYGSAWLALSPALAAGPGACSGTTTPSGG